MQLKLSAGWIAGKNLTVLCVNIPADTDMHLNNISRPEFQWGKKTTGRNIIHMAGTEKIQGDEVKNSCHICEVYGWVLTSWQVPATYVLLLCTIFFTVVYEHYWDSGNEVYAVMPGLFTKSVVHWKKALFAFWQAGSVDMYLGRKQTINHVNLSKLAEPQNISFFIFKEQVMS